MRSEPVRTSIWIGFEPRESDAYAVARRSMRMFFPSPYIIRGVVLEHLRRIGLYWRPTSRRDGKLWDDISEAPMATEFAISRFLVPALAAGGWALFTDCDVMARKPLHPLFKLIDQSKAVMVVKHNHHVKEGSVKMDGQIQTNYTRKNWSSVCLFNCDHPSNRKLTVDMVNQLPGRDLHRFCWLKDEEIGELGPEWNWLVGHSPEEVDPSIVHFTDGTPSMPGYEDVPFADEWRNHLMGWAS